MGVRIVYPIVQLVTRTQHSNRHFPFFCASTHRARLTICVAAATGMGAVAHATRDVHWVLLEEREGGTETEYTAAAKNWISQAHPVSGTNEPNLS